MFLTINNLGNGISPLASPVHSFTFDTTWKPLTSSRKSSLKPSLSLTRKDSPSKKKNVRFSDVVSQKFFYPVAQSYHLDSWPSSLRLLSPAHLACLFFVSLLLGIGGCVAYPLSYKGVAFLLWSGSLIVISILCMLATTIIVKRSNAGGFGKILSRV